MENILKEIGIDLPGQYSRNGNYVVDLSSDAEWGRIYSLLETADDVSQDEDNNLLTVHNASLMYEYANCQINLKADFDNDIYQLVCSELYEVSED